MEKRSVTAEDILAEDKDFVEKDGLLLRKGTFAATVANAKLYGQIVLRIK